MWLIWCLLLFLAPFDDVEIIPLKGGVAVKQVQKVEDNKPKLHPAWSAQNIFQFHYMTIEVMDERELRYTLVKPEEFLSDLRMLENRVKDLADAPFICDTIILPDRTLVNELLMFNRAHLKYLNDCKQLYHYRKDIQDAIQETELLYQVWDCVRDARCEYYYVHIRRQALKKLEGFLGPICDPKFQLPPHVPIWRFTHLR